MDLKFTGIGSSLYLPVFNKGAQFFTGDGHAVQGDGEVDGGRLKSRSSQRCNSFYTRARALNRRGLRR
jgi:hypothetical protein